MERTTQDVREFRVSGPRAAATARDEFVSVAYDWLSPGVIAEARLVLHEIVSAITLGEGADTEITVRVTKLASGGVRAEAIVPRRRGAARPTRALNLLTGTRRDIVLALSDRRGILFDASAPSIWFEIHPGG